jgi:rhodanese-related sulfurtransferase
MAIRRVTPEEAASLVAAGHRYVDVRSAGEFEQGHPTGAYNVPFMHQVNGQMTPNPDFLAAFTAQFAPEDSVVVGCRSGARSLRAAEALAAAGYHAIVDMRGGFAGEPGVPGWRACNLPVATRAEPGRDWETLRPK